VRFLTEHPVLHVLLAVAAGCLLVVVFRGRATRAVRTAQRLDRLRPGAPPAASGPTYAELLTAVHREAVAAIRGHIDPRAEPHRAADVRPVVEHLIDARAPLLNRIEYHKLVADVLGRLGFPAPDTDPTGPPP
jgi:hypothetical protein